MRLFPILAVSALSLSLSAAVLAHDAEGPARSPEAMHAFLQSPEGQAQMQQRLDKHLDTVREALKLDDAQGKGWQDFSASLKADLAQLRQLRAQAQPAEGQKLGLPERLQQHLDNMRAAQPILEHALGELKTFYASLNPEQQAVADRQLSLRGLMGHGGHGGQHGRDKQR